MLLTDQDPFHVYKPALDNVRLLYILYLLPSGSPACIIWDIHRQVFLTSLVPLSMLIHLGYPQCCVNIPFDFVKAHISSFVSCCGRNIVCASHDVTCHDIERNREHNENAMETQCRNERQRMQ